MEGRLDCGENAIFLKTKYIRNVEAMHSMMDEITTLKVYITTLEQNALLDNSNNNNVTTETDVERLEIQVQAIRAENETLQQERTTQRDAMTRIQEQYDALKATVVEEKLQMESIATEEKNTLEETLMQNEILINALKNQVQVMTETNEEREREYMELSVQLEETLGTANQLTTQTEYYVDRIKTLETVIETLKSSEKESRTTLINESGKMQSKITNYRNHVIKLEGIKSKNDSFQKENRKINEQMRILKAELKTTNSTLKSSESAHSRLLKDSTEKVNTLQTTVDVLKMGQTNLDNTLQLQSRLCLDLQRDLEKARAMLFNHEQQKAIAPPPRNRNNANFAKYVKLQGENEALIKQIQTQESLQSTFRPTRSKKKFSLAGTSSLEKTQSPYITPSSSVNVPENQRKESV